MSHFLDLRNIYAGIICIMQKFSFILYKINSKNSTFFERADKKYCSDVQISRDSDA